MKYLPALLVAVGLTVSTSWSQTTTLATFGTDEPFVIDPEFGDLDYTQGAATITLNTPFAAGQIIFGAFGSLTPAEATIYDWSAVDELALSLSSIVPPQAFLTLDFVGPDLLTVIATASVPVGGISGTPSSVLLEFSSGSIGDLTEVGGLYFAWDGDSSEGETAVTVHSIQAVPEPSTWALLGLGAALLGVVVWRRRGTAAS
jgi:hypothetical protein